MKILILDTYYPDFLATLRFDESDNYDAALRKVLNQCFGTFDAYSRNLRALGWEAADVIVNCSPLQELWAREHGCTGDVLAAQIENFKPDVIFLQDLSIEIPWPRAKVIAGQCSCPMPATSSIQQCDVLFTSFPHYLAEFEALGVRAVYNPLAFDPIVTVGRTSPPVDREIDLAFVGGVGAPSHWAAGMRVLETIAREIPTSFFWGYGYDLLPMHSPMRQRYRGQAWGKRMYEILQRSKIVINRHGEVARGFANNMKLFETTGCGALLLTEAAPNLASFFAADEAIGYTSPEDAVEHIRYYLDNFEERRAIAMAGQERTMRDHTYSKRMQTVSDVLREMVL